MSLPSIEHAAAATARADRLTIGINELAARAASQERIISGMESELVLLRGLLDEVLFTDRRNIHAWDALVRRIRGVLNSSEDVVADSRDACPVCWGTGVDAAGEACAHHGIEREIAL